MLQIATGKLFSIEVERENLLRGVLYSNAVIGYTESIDTVAGKLLPTDSSQAPQAIFYEFFERIERSKNGPTILLSSGVDPYLQDFAVVVSFALNCVCSPDIDLCRRLTGGGRGIATREIPSELVQKVFNKNFWCTVDDRKFLVDFTEKLIGLPRLTFLGVMRALRTYVNGMFRIGDDLELAYTLLVASVESLAQDFDKHPNDWDSYQQDKRNSIDEALAEADSQIAQKVRDAILKYEHVALGRRFREFVISHTKADYFRPHVKPAGTALCRADLRDVLIKAYEARSKYVHQLKKLPHMVTVGHGFHETALDGRDNYLTLQGLSRLMRNAIIEFVYSQPSVEREVHDYALERSGVHLVKLSPEFWIGNTTGDLGIQGRDKFEGFLTQLSLVISNAENAAFTDIRHVLQDVSGILPKLEKRLRRPYLALIFLFNLYVRPEDKSHVSKSIEELIDSDLGECSSESLLVYAICEQEPPWSRDEHSIAIENYFKRRSIKNGLRFPRLLESASILWLAERYRLAGEIDKCAKAVAVAVENNPGYVKLLEFEQHLNFDCPIKWRDILLPKTDQIESDPA